MKVSSVFVLSFLSALAFAAPEPNTSESDNGRHLKYSAPTPVARTPSATLEARSTVGTVLANALKCRTCPKTSCTAVRQYSDGQHVTVTCAQYKGTTVVEGNAYWDKTVDGCWVAEYYMWFTISPNNC